MSERDPYARKVAEESADFLELFESIFEAMGEQLPEDERKLFEEAAADALSGVDEIAEHIRSGAIDDELVAHKPPALWELEKAAFNRQARELGLDEIPEHDEEESK